MVYCIFFDTVRTEAKQQQSSSSKAAAGQRRSQGDGHGVSWWRGWVRPVPRRVRMSRLGRGRPRCARSRAGSLPLPAIPWIGWVWGREVRPSGRLGGSGTIGGGGVVGRGRGRANTVGTKAGKEGRDVPRVRQG
jgi:hypothetical protein